MPQSNKPDQSSTPPDSAAPARVPDGTTTGGSDEFIPLDKFLKLAQVVQSGGEAKMLIQTNSVRVNGEIETRRGRKLRNGDRVEVNGEEYVIETD